MKTVIHRFTYAVPSQGVPIYSESDFEDPQDGINAMERAFSDGQISDWKYIKITVFTEQEVVMEQHK